jgi:hypothetical protein
MATIKTTSGAEFFSGHSDSLADMADRLSKSGKFQARALAAISRADAAISGAIARVEDQTRRIAELRASIAAGQASNAAASSEIRSGISAIEREDARNRAARAAAERLFGERK